jgi:hypothetical protein
MMADCIPGIRQTLGVTGCQLSEGEVMAAEVWVEPDGTAKIGYALKSELVDMYPPESRPDDDEERPFIVKVSDFVGSS